MIDSEKKNLKVFGYGLAVLLSILAYKIWRDHGWTAIHMVFAVFIGGFLIITTAHYKLLTPLYRRWMLVAHAIGNIVTGFILTVLFYLVFGVVGLVLRLMHKDLLDRRLDPDARSYWIPKEPVPFEQGQYQKQF